MCGEYSRLIKKLWIAQGNRIAVRFVYEWHDNSGSWLRWYGYENWAFDAFSLMKRRIASIHDLPIKEEELISYSTCVFLQY
ncbi:MAG: DUF1348 family protein [Methylococcales bacterium]